VSAFGFWALVFFLQSCSLTIQELKPIRQYINTRLYVYTSYKTELVTIKHPNILFIRINNMTQNIHNLFKQLKNIEPSQDLEGKILRSIALKKSWREKRRLIFADALGLFSIGSFVFALLIFWEGFSRSAFWSLSRLIFSDTGAVMSFWRDFLFSLLETFPAVHLAAILAPVFLLMVSLKIYFSRNNFNFFNK
jgi:hypothetical protein